ncbi:hypothetical protein PS941_00654 [Pseudomonas fluorescens]|uniref:LysR substrate-binding domain-containing protein n=1 Tax=Pseudomonas fluorescens TaxID=294 RepID=A0A5E7RZZ9_PSEFL|nr:hypothetical protein PS941_00654 [Pseudomonas fluorescens]
MKFDPLWERACSRRLTRHEAPGIDLQISHASREGMLEGVLNGDIDVAAGVFPEMPHELRSSVLFEERYVCLLDRQTLPASGVLDLPTYLSRPHVLLEMRGSGTPEIERALTSLRERRRVAISLPHWNVAPQFISGTDLILTVSSRSVRELDQRELIVVPPPFEIAPFTFVLAWHKRRGGDQALNWLNRTIEEGIEICPKPFLPSLWQESTSMKNTQNLQPALTNAIRNQIGPIRNDPLSSAWKATFAT